MILDLTFRCKVGGILRKFWRWNEGREPPHTELFLRYSLLVVICWRMCSGCVFGSERRDVHAAFFFLGAQLFAEWLAARHDPLSCVARASWSRALFVHFFFGVSQPQETTLEALCGSAELVACYTTSVTLTSIFRYSNMVMLDVPSVEHGILMTVLGSRRATPLPTDGLQPGPPLRPDPGRWKDLAGRTLGGPWKDPGRILGGPREGTPFLTVKL